MVDPVGESEKIQKKLGIEELTLNWLLFDRKICSLIKKRGYN
jgi:hypothetical protein